MINKSPLNLFFNVILPLLFISQACAGVQDDFIKAAQESNLHEVRELTTQGVNINEKGSKGYSALYIATARRHIDVVTFLLSNGAEVESTNKFGYTPLMAASQNGWEDIVNIMISKGANVNARTITGLTLLTQAVRGGNSNVIRSLIQNGADISNTSIRRAIIQGNKDIVEILISSGMKSNAAIPPPLSRQEGVVPGKSMVLGKGVSSSSRHVPQSLLSVALQAKQEEIALLLMNNGASIEEVSRNKNDTANPLFVMALEGSMFTVAKALIERGADVNRIKRDYPLISYFVKLNKTSKSFIETIKFLYDQGADIEKRPVRKNGATPIILAASNGDKAIVELLLSYGANINAQYINPPGYGSSDQGATALTLACKNKKKEITKFLLEKGADPNIADSSGYPPVFYAIRSKSSIESVQALLDYGVDPNQIWKDLRSFNKDKISPLRVALRAKNNEVANLLLKYGADIRADAMAGMIVEAMVKKDKEVIRFLVERGGNLDDTKGYSLKRGLSPLMYAAQIGDVSYLQYFLDNGAEIDLQNGNGDTALIKAVLAENLNSVFLLITHGADVNIENKEGFTPYWYAKRIDNKEMEDLLVKHGASTISYNAHALKVTALKASGLIPSEVSPAEIWPKELEMYLALMTNRFGIDKPEEYKPDSRLSSPEKTWELHKQSAINGDFTLLEKTLTRPGHPLLEIFKSLSIDKRRGLINEMKSIEQITQDESKAKYRIHKTIKGEEITFYIYFTKMFGEWRIEDY
jgi:ankyrin repeat protein